MRISHIIAMSSLLVGADTLSAADDSWKATRLWVAGGDRQTWVVGASESKGGTLPRVHMWHTHEKGIDALPTSSSRFLPPIDGDPERVGSHVDGLRILFSNRATWHYFPNRQASAGPSWDDHCRGLPLAWAGDASKPVFWALVETADLVSDARKTSSRPTGAAVTDGRTEGPRLTLFRIRQGFWDRLPVPAQAEAGQAFWLAGREETVYLFWQSSSHTIFFSRLDDTKWSPPEAVATEKDVVSGWAGAYSQGPVFVAGRGSADRIQLHVFRRDSESWSYQGIVREGSDYVTLDPKVSGVGVCQGKLGVARANDTGQVEFGRADLDESPLLRFSPLPRWIDTAPPVGNWTDIVAIVAALGLLTLVLFYRRDQVHRPAAVPHGFVIASAWRRVLATAIDFVPTIIVINLCSDMINQALGPSDDPAMLVEQLSDPERVKKLLPLTLLFLSVYGFWCMAWELLSGTTLGKRIFDCRVLSVDGMAPTPRQIIVRNLARIVTFALGPPGLMMTLMLMLMFTRNRQRLGDLLANTIVVQPNLSSVLPQTRSRDRDDSSDDHW